jgi:two-component system cell cycle response regulator DivK
MTTQKLVWIIDDDPGIREVTQIVLEEAGFMVKTISSEKELQTQWSIGLPQVVLLDIFIPAVDVKDVVNKLRKAEPNLKIVVMSANTNIEQKTKELGADSFLKKPYDIADLEKVVKDYTGVV